MARSRVLWIASAAALAAGVLALPAQAARPIAWDHTLTTQHFMVHYHTDTPGGVPAPDYSTETDAGDIAAYAEQAYGTYLSWGYAAPPVGVDGYIDIYVEDLSGPPLQVSIAGPDGAGPAGSSGYFELATPTQLQLSATQDGVSLANEERQVVAANVFYMFEAGQWVPTTGGDLWLLYGPGTWASFDEMSFMPPPLAIGNPDIALNCSETILPEHQMCAPSFYDDGGFARWSFFELLASKYGKSFLKTVFANGGLGQSSTTALSNALALKGTTLAAVYNDYVSRYMSGTLGPASLDGARPPAWADVATGASAVTTPTTVAIVPANHLAARYVTFERGDGDASHACYAATLTVNVALQYDSGSKSLSSISSTPYFYWDVSGSSPQPLSVNGSTASITVPWDTCDWGATRGWVSLPNASSSVDGATFTVSYSTTVDTKTPATASPPPSQTSVWGTTVPTPTTDFAPTIDVFGPELIKVSATSRVIRLIVDSSSVGSLNASLGSTPLGTRALRAGNNDVRFTVPASMLTALRKSASVTNVLTLTPMSSSGATAGQPVTRHVSLTAAVKAKPKHKKPKK
jgi:hypothetical protein